MRVFRVLLISMFLCVGCANASENPTGIIDALAKQIPERPKGLSSDELALMQKVGKTQTFEAALVLIRALALQLDPALSNEPLTGAELIPAIGILKREFGKAVWPLIFVEGILLIKSGFATGVH